MCSNGGDFNKRSQILTPTFNKVIDTINFVKRFSKFYYRLRFGCLKIILQQVISDPVFYGDLVYKYKKFILLLFGIMGFVVEL